MKTKELEEKERNCLSLMKKGEYDAFKYLFHDFQDVYEITRTQYTSKVKACYLMILLMENWQDYLYFLQKLDYEDIADEHVKFVLNLEILLGEKNPENMKNERGKYKEFDDCLKKIISLSKDEQNKQYQMEQLLVEERKEENPTDTIKSCLEFAQKFNKI